MEIPSSQIFFFVKNISLQGFLHSGMTSRPFSSTSTSASLPLPSLMLTRPLRRWKWPAPTRTSWASQISGIMSVDKKCRVSETFVKSGRRSSPLFVILDSVGIFFCPHNVLVIWEMRKSNSDSPQYTIAISRCSHCFFKLQTILEYQ